MTVALGIDYYHLFSMWRSNISIELQLFNISEKREGKWYYRKIYAFHRHTHTLTVQV